MKVLFRSNIFHIDVARLTPLTNSGLVLVHDYNQLILNFIMVEGHMGTYMLHAQITCYDEVNELRSFFQCHR